MFDALEKRFKKDKHDEADLINHLYQGTLKDYVKCLECGYESAREDHFLDIPLVIKPFGSNKAYGSVEEALEAFVEPETLTADNQYNCEHCQKKCDAHKGLKFKSFPYLLTLQLKRFDFDYSTMHRIKLNDRMTFPRILDLNQFVLPEDMLSVPEDVEEVYRDFVVEEFDPRPPPYNYYGRSGNTPSYSNAVSSTFGGSSDHRTSASRSHDVDQTVADSNNDESEVADGNDEGEGERGGGGTEVEESPTELTVGQRMRRGPYVYELFSIMIHSGSAIGGHYYAYIKSFADKKWYCFNDQSVSKLNEEDIECTFGGPDSRSRGYYSSMYASSANAYMLMYRRINRSKNKDFLPKEDLPQHVLEQIKEDRRLQEEKRRLEEYERSLCKFRLFSRHPVSGELVEKKIEVQNQWILRDTVTEAHKILELQDVVPVARCRLVRYDEYSECLDQSFDENEGMEETFSIMVGGPRNYYSFELFLEMRAEDEVFKPYNRGGLNLKMLLVNLETLKVASPVAMRAEQSWTVLTLKEAVSEKFGLSVETMNLAVETYQNEGRHLANDSHQLKHESLFKKHTIFACSDPEDFRKPFKESEMNKLIDVHVNSILLYVTIPPPPQRPAIATTTAETTEERDEEREGGVAMESSVDIPAEQPAADTKEAPPTTSEGAGTGGSEISPPEAPPPTEDAVDMTKDRPLQRTIEVRIDRRSTLQDLKDMLVDYVQQPSQRLQDLPSL
ncbi:Ubiquitin carboxyl-terminal hydrolase 47 [Geodia barretti]|nr:Ubiquitin carboxyl-terminal hydrolase 47 [Geodia barretti]